MACGGTLPVLGYGKRCADIIYAVQEKLYLRLPIIATCQQEHIMIGGSLEEIATFPQTLHDIFQVNIDLSITDPR